MKKQGVHIVPSQQWFPVAIKPNRKPTSQFPDVLVTIALQHRGITMMYFKVNCVGPRLYSQLFRRLRQEARKLEPNLGNLVR